jgi:Tol biopolymer transport system component
MRFRINLRAIILAAAGVAACDDSPTGSQAGGPLRFSGAANASDTIEAIIPQALVVEVHDTTGALAPAGTVVRFTAAQSSFLGPDVLVQAPMSSYSDLATGLVDNAGKTSVRVQLGRIAGTARLAVSVPALGLLDTVRFTVTPGNAALPRVTPGDTALYVGKSYTLRGSAIDRRGNPRTAPVTWSTSGAGVTVTSAGVVTATALGRYQIRADGVELGGLTGNDIGWVSVVPSGRLTAVTPGSSVQSRVISTLDADGSNQTTVVTVTQGQVGAHPAWIPGTSTVVYTAMADGLQKLFTVGSDGVPKLFFPVAPPTVSHQAEPTPTADGKWLFFSVYDTRCSDVDYCIARSRIDGSGYELLGTAPSRQPAPSPDGTKVAFVAFVTPGSPLIRVLDVATRTSSAWSVSGTMPAWSPDGTRIAYRKVGTELSVVTPDGTAPPMPTLFVYDVSGWSPDSKWVIVLRSPWSELVDPTTGTMLPLSYGSNMSVTSMK